MIVRRRLLLSVFALCLIIYGTWYLFGAKRIANQRAAIIVTTELYRCLRSGEAISNKFASLSPDVKGRINEMSSAMGKVLAFTVKGATTQAFGTPTLVKVFVKRQTGWYWEELTFHGTDLGSITSIFVRRRTS